MRIEKKTTGVQLTIHLDAEEYARLEVAYKHWDNIEGEEEEPDPMYPVWSLILEILLAKEKK